MDNTLQVRISADISALQSALTKAKTTIKTFETETEKESEKGGVGFKRKIGLIEQLTNKAKALRTALSQATNETQVAKYNAQLEETSRELTRLNALGRSVTSNLGSTASGFGQVATKGANANGVAIEFNRIIQDAPFGIIGIGNNLQQLAGNFSQVSKQAGGAGKAIAASFTSIVSPVNLGLLAISALTAGFTAYQMGAFDGIFATEDFTESLEKFKESLSAVDSARLEGIGNADKEIVTLNSLRGIIESETTSRKAKLDAVNQLQELYPAYFGNLTQEQILAGDLTKTYEALTKTILAKAQAEASTAGFIELEEEKRLILKKTADERARIAEFEAKALQNQKDGQIELQTINENQVRFLTGKIQPELNRINEIKEEQKTLEDDITANLIEANAVLTVQKTRVKDVANEYDELIAKVEMSNQFQKEASTKFSDLTKGLDAGGTKPIVDIPITFNIIPEDSEIDESKLTEFILRLQEFNDKIAGVLEQGTEQSLGDFAYAIGASLAEGGNVLKASGAALLGGLGSILGQLGQMAIATGIAIAGIKKALQTLNPFVAIAAGVALVALAGFVGGKARSLGGSMSGGGAGSSGGFSGGSAGTPPTIFTNSQIPSIPGSSAPSPSGNIDFDREQGRITTTVSGEDIVFVYDRYQERKKGGG